MIADAGKRNRMDEINIAVIPIGLHEVWSHSWRGSDARTRCGGWGWRRSEWSWARYWSPPRIHSIYKSVARRNVKPVGTGKIGRIKGRPRKKATEPRWSCAVKIGRRDVVVGNRCVPYNPVMYSIVIAVTK